MSDYKICFVTAPDEDTAKLIAYAVIKDNLAACVNIIKQIESIYLWQGKIEKSDEYLLIIKTQLDRIFDLRDRVVSLHPYDTPEFIVCDIIGGYKPYLDWITESTNK